MAQLTPTANELIINSLYLLGELGVGETPDAFMLSTGLELLNEIINGFTADSIYIPYVTSLNFTMVPGQASYTISTQPGADITSDRVVEIDYANYLVQNVSYPIKVISKAVYYNNHRLEDFQSRPSTVFLDKQAPQSTITFYPVPDMTYPCTIQVKSMLDEITEHQVLDQLPPYVVSFLKYALAKRFLAYYPSQNWPASTEEIYQEMYANLKNANEVDLTIQPSGILEDNNVTFWPAIIVG